MLDEKLRLREIKTKYGVIYTRDALVLVNFSLKLAPFEIVVVGNLALSGCRPETNDESKVDLKFEFKKVKNFSVYLIDNYPGEKYSHSSFDEYIDQYGNGVGRYVLSTYDHVFDIRGEYSLTEC